MVRRIIEATTKCPGCKKQIGFLNNYNEENETGECFICKIKLKMFHTRIVKA